MINGAKWFAAAAAIALAAGPASGGHSWGNYHWPRSSNPVALTVERQIGSQWETSFYAAVADWDAPHTTVLDLTAGTANLGVSPKKCDPINGKVLACSDSYGFRGWLGVATVWINGDHIYQATTKVNDSYFNTSTYNTPAWRALVMCQEIGHDFGLDHQDETFDNPNLGTCQDYTNDPDGGEEYGPSNERPNPHDYEQLETIYAHLDEGGGGGGGDGGCNPRSPKCNGQDAFTFREVGSAGTSARGPSSSEWGRAIGYDGAGRPNTYALDLGGGRQKITHVFWVPGFRPQPHHIGDAH